MKLDRLWDENRTGQTGTDCAGDPDADALRNKNLNQSDNVPTEQQSKKPPNSEDENKE